MRLFRVVLCMVVTLALRPMGTALAAEEAATEVSKYKSYSKYSMKVSVSSKGKWRVCSYHSDSKHAPTYSAWRCITVT